MIRQINFKSLLYLLFAAAIYALIFPINLISIENGATTFGNTFWQTFTGGLILVIANFKKKITFLKVSNLCLQRFSPSPQCGHPLPIDIVEPLKELKTWSLEGRLFYEISQLFVWPPNRLFN